jgi:hypothetical protein
MRLVLAIKMAVAVWKDDVKLIDTERGVIVGEFKVSRWPAVRACVTCFALLSSKRHKMFELT